ncbi:hypothetical protein E1301_Tti015497 [Triplophysa tibetana]|uniref:Uncharacterized protein n=1 Tax=Triplophysa tibetana TaxID=1572043 RepID=A0A5A9PLI1_9TELE|nr:hypothetical protein E1301_Tti015497 [Triplophysa tibetana]
MSGNRQLTHEHDNSEAGYSGTRFEINNIEIEARGPNSSIESEASLDKFTSMTRIEVGSVSAKVPYLPVTVKAGLGFDTGASVGRDGVEAKFLGTGFSFGRKMGISLFGLDLSYSTQRMETPSNVYFNQSCRVLSSLKTSEPADQNVHEALKRMSLCLMTVEETVAGVNWPLTQFQWITEERLQSVLPHDFN